MKYQSLRGMRDLIGSDAEKIFLAEVAARKIFKTFNYSEIKLPIMEEASLFLRGIGETSDIVEKQMYTFKDKGDRTVALRPEGTAGVVRSYIQKNLHILPITKLFYAGPMFRYERPQEGRYREFYQIGCEYFGNPHFSADAEIILVAQEIIRSYGSKNFKISVNSVGCRDCRPKFSEAISEYASKIQDSLCSDCQRRMTKNPLRVFDCKVDSDKLENFPESLSFVCLKCLDNFNQTKTLLDDIGINVVDNPKLVRGLDYYSGTVFEITSDILGAQSAIAAGGRYDYLIEELGGKPTPAVGFALGVERLAFTVPEAGQIASKRYFIIVSDEKLLTPAIKLGYALREKRVVTEWPLMGRSVKSQLNCANKLLYDYVIIFSQNEFDKGEIVLKNMTDGTQNNLKIDDFLKLAIE